MSEVLFFAENGENMLCTKIVLNVRNNFCTQHVLPRFVLGIFMYWTCNSLNNLLSYCGLVDAKIRASDKDLPVWSLYSKNLFWFQIIVFAAQARCLFCWALRAQRTQDSTREKTRQIGMCQLENRLCGANIRSWKNFNEFFL